MSEDTESLREKFLEKLDFLSAHWCEGDEQPFSFGGWRDEVADEFVAITAQEVKKAELALLKRLDDSFVDLDSPRVELNWALVDQVLNDAKSQIMQAKR